MTDQATTLDSILSIPGNRTVFDALIKLMAENKAIAFVGAGASAGMYPLWGQFIEMLADYTVSEGKAEEKDATRWKADKTSTPQQRVNNILRKLGEIPYRNFLKATFGPRKSDDGKRYMPMHSVLLSLPFRGYVTTNYDPALEFARMELRPASVTAGTPTWQDDDEVYRWLTGDIFSQPDDCPIFWIHGYWQRPNGIVLNAGEYAQAYKPSLYRRTFERFWMQDHLVFIGFSFSDPQFTFMVGEMMRDIADAHTEPRHIAILGFPIEDNNAFIDSETIREWRDNLESDYHVRALFYPVAGLDHSTLLILLESLRVACRSTPISPVTASPVKAATFVHEKWIHKTSNDDNFTGREDEIERLNRWAKDEAVRAIGVTAVGGTGKTALIGHWLKKTIGWRSRPFAGLFAWSFYQNRDTESFLRQLLLWAHDIFGPSVPDEKTNPIPAAFAVLRAQPLIIVLDGLEVLQEGPNEARYGSFLDGALREFLAEFCHKKHASLVVLTSRFIFADIERYLGTAFHQLELHGLSPRQGATLLDELGVRGMAVERQQISNRLDGHPLALRVFVDTLPEAARDQPLRFLDHAFRPDELPVGAPLNDKVRRLLVFYEKKLPSEQVHLLSVIALFRAPVADEIVLRLVRGLYKQNTDKPLPDETKLASELKKLHARGILTREPIEESHGSTCHPILRDHFRSVLLSTGADTARRTADLLKEHLSERQPQSVKEIEPVLLAVDLLLDVGEFQAADELYEKQLKGGDVFLSIPALQEGFACSLGFVRDETRRKQCEEKLSQWRLGYYLNNVGNKAKDSGNFELALPYNEASVVIARELHDEENLSISLQSRSNMLFGLGRLDEARQIATEALHVATQARNKEASYDIDYNNNRQRIRHFKMLERYEDTMGRSHGYRGWAAALAGQVNVAVDDFTFVTELECRNDPYGDGGYSIGGIVWAELLLRSGLSALSRRRANVYLRVSERNRWHDQIALCHWVLGGCSLAEARLDNAEEELRTSEHILHHGHLLFWLACLHVTAGQVALARQDSAAALQRAAEAFDLAVPRRMRLVHADALVLRGRAWLLQDTAESTFRAFDDAEDALHIARECGYVWAERDALFLQVDAVTALSSAYQATGELLKAEKARHMAQQALSSAEALSASLRLMAEDLANVETKVQLQWEDWKKERLPEEN